MTRAARAALSMGAGATLLAVAAYIAARAAAVPYNVRELFGGGHAPATAIGLAAAVYWVFGAPAALAVWLGAGARARAALFPAAVAAHAAIAWFLLRAAVPLESLYDIVGSPVLRWPWEWELLGRFVALLGAATVLGTGAAALAAALWGEEPRRWGAVARWGIAAAVLLPIAHVVVVSKAATDNLTELMAGGGNPASTAAISVAVFLIAFAGATLARLAAGARRAPAAAVAVLLSAPAAYAALALGLESHVEKYGQVFSALQFLLSRDRASLAGGAELNARYAAAHAGAVFLIALALHPLALLSAGRGSPAPKAPRS